MNFLLLAHLHIDFQNVPQFFVPIVFETIFGLLGYGNSLTNTKNKGYQKLGVPENERNLYDGIFRTIAKSLKAHPKV